jgi:hypothetical protein
MSNYGKNIKKGMEKNKFRATLEFKFFIRGGWYYGKDYERF